MFWLSGFFCCSFRLKFSPNQFKYPFFLKTFSPTDGPELPLKNVYDFFKNIKNFERVDIAKDPADIPAPVNRNNPEEVNVEIEAKEVIGGNVAWNISLTIGLTTAKCPAHSSEQGWETKLILLLKNHPL